MRFFHSNTESIIQNFTAGYACRDAMVAATTNEFSFHGLIRVNITYSRLKKSLNIFIFLRSVSPLPKRGQKRFFFYYLRKSVITDLRRLFFHS